MSWQPMSREQAEQILGEFLERSRGQAITTSFEDYLRYREAFLILAGHDPEDIRRELEKERGVPFD